MFLSCCRCFVQVSSTTESPLHLDPDSTVLVRVVAFTMRAILSGSDTAGRNRNVVIAELIIYNVGFFGLLYSAYTLVLDRFVRSCFLSVFGDLLLPIAESPCCLVDPRYQAP